MFLSDSLVNLINFGPGGIGGVSPIEKKGAIRFQITDEEGKQREILLKNVF